jgi:hypothetical protein
MIGGGLPQDATQVKLDVSAIHFLAEAWRLRTASAINNCRVKCSFSVDHVICNDDSAVKLTEDEEDDWHSLHPLGMQFKDYTTCDSALEVCGIQSIDQVLDQYFTRPEEEDKVAEHKATFLDALKPARKHICQSDTENSIIVMCNKIENVRFEVFTAVAMKNAVFWDVVPCRSCVHIRSMWHHIPEEGILQVQNGLYKLKVQKKNQKTLIECLKK